MNLAEVEPDNNLASIPIEKMRDYLVHYCLHGVENQGFDSASFCFIFSPVTLYSLLQFNKIILGMKTKKGHKESPVMH